MNELIKQFGINWRLLLAQAVNFLVLLYILKRFAYTPILNMLRKRKEEIAKGILLRDEAEENLAQIGVLKETTIEEAKKEALEIVSKGEVIAKEKREAILAETVKKSEGIITEAKRVILQEKAIMTEKFIGDAEELVRMGIVKVIGRMPAEERDRELIHEAMQALK